MITSSRSWSDSTLSITGVNGAGKFSCQSWGTPMTGVWFCAWAAQPPKPNAAIASSVPKRMPNTPLADHAFRPLAASPASRGFPTRKIPRISNAVSTRYSQVGGNGFSTPAGMWRPVAAVSAAGAVILSGCRCSPPAARSGKGWPDRVRPLATLSRFQPSSARRASTAARVDSDQPVAGDQPQCTIELAVTQPVMGIRLAAWCSTQGGSPARTNCGLIAKDLFPHSLVFRD